MATFKRKLLPVLLVAIAFACLAAPAAAASKQKWKRSSQRKAHDDSWDEWANEKYYKV